MRRAGEAGFRKKVQGQDVICKGDKRDRYKRTYTVGLLNVRCWLSRWPWVSQFLEVAIVEVPEDIETDFVFSERLGVLDEAKSLLATARYLWSSRPFPLKCAWRAKF